MSPPMARIAALLAALLCCGNVAGGGAFSHGRRAAPCLPATLYLGFGGYSWGGDYTYVEAGGGYTDKSEYGICDASSHLWSKASGTGVLCWSASGQFTNQWIYLYFNGYGASMYGGFQCSGYTANPLDCDLISSTYGLNSATATGGCAHPSPPPSPSPSPPPVSYEQLAQNGECSGWSTATISGESAEACQALCDRSDTCGATTWMPNAYGGPGCAHPRAALLAARPPARRMPVR